MNTSGPSRSPYPPSLQLKDLAGDYQDLALAGIGAGLYTAVIIASVTDVLLKPDKAAKEMGVFFESAVFAAAGRLAIRPVSVGRQEDDNDGCLR